MRTAAICFCLCLVANQVLAQAEQPKLGGLAATGLVVGPDGQPQPGVPLTVEGPQGKTLAVTDERGAWSLYNLAPGLYSIQPAVGQKDASRSAPVNFNVKKRSVFDSLIGTEASVYKAPAMRIDKAR
jgi:hypothetical protein